VWDWEKYKKRFNELFFWEGNFVLEKQIFNATIIISLFFMFALLLFNVVIGNIRLLIVSVIVIHILIFCFYLLRKRNRYKHAYYIFSSMGYPLMAIAFYFNDGILGPTFYILLFFHFVVLSISPNRKFFIWSLINGLVFLSLFFVGNFYGEFIPSNYENKALVFLDHSLTYLATMAGIAFLVSTFKNFYVAQKNKVKEKSQELIQMNRDLSRSSAQKDKIITIISHDLKNPLHSIMQTLELINQGDLPKEEMDFLHEELLKITKRTYNMMENILDWSSFEMKNQQVRIKEIEIKQLFDDTLEILKVIGRQKNLEIKVSYIQNPVVRLETDRLLLILRNLVQNAIKFTEPNGTITLEVNAEDEDVVIIVSDNGIGISKERMGKIFDLEIKSTYGTAQEKGTGMGLHLCFQNAKKLGGEIEVESTEGKGSKFVLRIPNGMNSSSASPF